MKRQIIFALTVLAITLALFASSPRAQAQSGGSYELTWSTIDGGGGAITGGAYSLSSTIGQPDAGTLSGSPYTLGGGFWFDLGGGSSSNNFLYLPLIVK